MQCPKCSYEPTLSEVQSSPDMCAKCGVVYAKLQARPAPVTAVDKQGVTFSDWLNSNRNAKWMIALLVGLVIGYFAGREHVKYEIRGALTDSLSGLGAIFGGSKSTEAPHKQEAETVPVKANENAPIKGELLSKGFYEGKYGQDQITFSLSFKNAAERDVRAFEGVLEFNDLLGNRILSSNIAINDPVPAGGAMPWDGGIDYNQFMDRHQRLRTEKQENVRMVFVLKKVLYADGQVEQF